MSGKKSATKRSREKKKEKEEIIEEMEEVASDEEAPKKRGKNVKSTKEEVQETESVVIPDDGGAFLSEIALKDEEKNLDEAQIAKRFATIADQVLNSYTLMIGGKPHRFLEVEFYWKGENHQDVFSHQHEDQKVCGKVQQFLCILIQVVVFSQNGVNCIFD